MKPIIFSGTTEGRELSMELAGLGVSPTVCVATEYGREAQGEIPGVTVLSGGMTRDEMAKAISDHDICIDATHPYAMEATENILSACGIVNAKYVRLKRGEAEVFDDDPVTPADDAEAAAEILKETDGNILLATGSKELSPYIGLGPERLYPRVLPTSKNIKKCEELGIPHKNIIAVQGPFGKEFNIALIRQFGIKHMVTKEDGAAGGFRDKVDAAKECGIDMIMLKRPDEEGLTMDEVIELFR